MDLVMHIVASEGQARVVYGILDTVDDVWIGDNDGPRLFDGGQGGLSGLLLAQVSAQVIETQVFGSDSGRYRATEFPGEPMRLMDEVPVRMDGEEALKLVESGG